MSWWLAAVEMGMYLFIVAVVMARSVAEAGLLMTETSFRPIDLVVLFTSKYRLGGGNLTVLAFLDAVFTRDLRGVLLSSFLDDQKMAENLRFQQRHLLVALVLAILAGLVCATYFSLTLIYRHGNITLYTYPNANALWAIQDAAAAMQVEESGSPARPLFFGIGLLFTLFLVAMRTLYVWWPFHPLGYALLRFLVADRILVSDLRDLAAQIVDPALRGHEAIPAGHAFLPWPDHGGIHPGRFLGHLQLPDPASRSLLPLALSSPGASEAPS
jgi:hypothetical protein